MSIVLVYMVIVNVVAFVMYVYDKQCAIRSKWRVSEFSLLTVASLGGALGAFFAMIVVCHKTRHLKFLVCVPLLLILQITLLLCAYYSFG